MPWFADWVAAGGPRPPENWPSALVSAWAEGLRGMSGPTPRQFGEAFLPQRARDLHLFVHHDGVSELCAIAHSMPVSAEQEHRAAKGLLAVLQHRQAFIWAANLDISIVPLSSTEHSLADRLAQRGNLEIDPLSVSDKLTRLAIPDEWTISRLERCQQHEVWTPRSTKFPCYVAAGPHGG